MQSYSQLSDDERDQIGILRAAGRSIGAIARALCPAKTTIPSLTVSQVGALATRTTRQASGDIAGQLNSNSCD